MTYPCAVPIPLYVDPDGRKGIKNVFQREETWKKGIGEERGRAVMRGDGGGTTATLTSIRTSQQKTVSVPPSALLRIDIHVRTRSGTIWTSLKARLRPAQKKKSSLKTFEGFVVGKPGDHGNWWSSVQEKTHSINKYFKICDVE